MKILGTIVLKNFKGEPLQENTVIKDGKSVKVPASLRDLLSDALLGISNNEIPTGTQRAERYRIVQKLYANDEANVTDYEVTVILQRIEDVYTGPMFYGKLTEAVKGELPENKTEAPAPLADAPVEETPAN